MEAQEIIDVIRKRRNAFWDRQLIDSEDAEVLAEAEFAKRVADEYESLLDEIKRIEKAQLLEKAPLVQIAPRQEPCSDE
jgi:hypothetical protein